ncbi:MAG: hypothetical protein ABUS48_00660 [Pseudomonadota bacterium]
MSAVEHLLAQYPSTINALMALATLGATIVALWAALAAQGLSRPRLIVHITTQMLAMLDGKPSLLSANAEQAHFLSVALKNRSTFPISIEPHSLWVKFPLNRTAAFIPPFEQSFAGGPRQLAPFSDQAIPWADIDEFVKSLATTINRERWWSKYFWCFEFTAKGGACVRLKVHRSVYRALPFAFLALDRYGRLDSRTLADTNPASPA